jgi:hypothetical protein
MNTDTQVFHRTASSQVMEVARRESGSRTDRRRRSHELGCPDTTAVPRKRKARDGRSWSRLGDGRPGGAWRSPRHGYTAAAHHATFGCGAVPDPGSANTPCQRIPCRRLSLRRRHGGAPPTLRVAGGAVGPRGTDRPSPSS